MLIDSAIKVWYAAKMELESARLRIYKGWPTYVCNDSWEYKANKRSKALHKISSVSQESEATRSAWTNWFSKKPVAHLLSKKPCCWICPSMIVQSEAYPMHDCCSLYHCSGENEIERFLQPRPFSVFSVRRHYMQQTVGDAVFPMMQGLVQKIRCRIPYIGVNI